MKLILVVLVIVIGTIRSSDSASMPRDWDQVPSEYTANSCPRRCTEDYYPICATNRLGESKVFVNDCYMALENCNQSPQRVFERSNRSNCPDYGEWISNGRPNSL